MADENKALPEWLNRPVGLISSLSPQMQQSFHEIVSDDGNLSRLSSLPKVVAAKLGLSSEEGIQVVSFLQWYSRRITDDQTFNQWFKEAALGSGYSKELVALVFDLASQVCFRIGSKALDLYLRTPQTWARAQITSDIRPVWDIDPDYATSPSAATVMHTLQLVCGGADPDDGKTVFVTLDAADLRTLGRLAQEALSKQHTLEEMIRGMGLPYVQVGEPEGGEEGDGGNPR